MISHLRLHSLRQRALDASTWVIVTCKVLCQVLRRSPLCTVGRDPWNS